MNLGTLLKGALSALTGGVSNLFEGDNLGNALNNAGNTWADIGNQNMLGNLVAKYTGSRLTNAEQQANAFNALEAQKNRDFQQSMFEQQTELANTAYQRQVADMQAAGINPMMAASGAGGAAVASPGSGATASSVAPAGAALNLGTILSFMLESKLLPAKIANLAADTAKKNADAESVSQQVDFFSRIVGLREEGENLSNDLRRVQMKQIEQSIDESKVRVGREIANTKESEARTKLALREAVLAKANADNIVFMRPYVAAREAAVTEKEQALAKASLVGAAYQQGLIDADVIGQGIKASNASIKVDDAIAELNRINALIAKGDKHALANELGNLDSFDFWANDVVSTLTKIVDSIPVNFVVK